MPKVAQLPAGKNPHNPLLSSGSNPHPNVLKRNQRIDLCYRLAINAADANCDAQRPCSTCKRSHAHAVSHATPGTVLPPHPDCTYDDIPEPQNSVTDAPKSKYERLETPELEALLRQRENNRSTSSSNPVASPSQDPESSPHLQYAETSPPTIHPSQSPEIIGSIMSTAATSASPLSGQDLMWSHWPPNLPNAELLRHLVEVFFTFHPHAHKLFHVPTFMHSLSLSPTHPKFPALPVLHAICAMGSLYTAAVPSSPSPDWDLVAPDEIFLERYRLTEQREDSFAEAQAKYAKQTAERLNSLGENLFQVLQTNIILTWFYWSHGRWVDIFLAAAHSMRLSVPLGLNICPPFHSITNSIRPPSILPPARTVVEDETRRNAFWLAYATERHHGLGNGWALSLDDQDVSQMLPVRTDQFLRGVLVAPTERQWAHSREMLLTHPPGQVDSFILYIKGTILISKVKAFNLRFRSKHFSGDPSVANAFDGVAPQPSDPVDPRGSMAFIELDEVVASFRAKFPPHLKDPINNNIVDSHLYTTCLMPLVATIVLHDPHAEVRQSGCISALKILSSARAILDLIYAVQSTSYDITLLDSFCTFSWFVGGRVLVRFLQAAIDAGSLEQMATLHAEINFLHAAITRVGERIPLAHRYAKMLEELLVKHCGIHPSVPIEIPFPRLTEPLAIQSMFCVNDDSYQKVSLHDTLHEPGSFLSLA